MPIDHNLIRYPTASLISTSSATPRRLHLLNPHAEPFQNHGMCFRMDLRMRNESPQTPPGALWPEARKKRLKRGPWTLGALFKELLRVVMCFPCAIHVLFFPF